jgi:hypothetical protein
MNSGEFAEPVVYTPSTGAPVTISAIVERGRIQTDAETGGRTVGKEIRISIARHATLGVLSIVKNGDKVSLPEVIGGASVSFIVADILTQDDGMWYLLLQR